MKNMLRAKRGGVQNELNAASGRVLFFAWLRQGALSGTVPQKRPAVTAHG